MTQHQASCLTLCHHDYFGDICPFDHFCSTCSPKEVKPEASTDWVEAKCKEFDKKLESWENYPVTQETRVKLWLRQSLTDAYNRGLAEGRRAGLEECLVAIRKSHILPKNVDKKEGYRLALIQIKQNLTKLSEK